MFGQLIHTAKKKPGILLSNLNKSVITAINPLLFNILYLFAGLSERCADFNAARATSLLPARPLLLCAGALLCFATANDLETCAQQQVFVQRKQKTE